MANYTPSNLLAAQAKLMGMFQAGELKYTDPRTYRLFLENAPIMFPDFNAIRTREDRTVNAYYKKRSARALGTGRGHAHTGAHGDSGVITPSWVTYHDHFATSLKQGNNNVFSLDEQMMNDWQNTLINQVEGHEATATAYLFAQRSGVNTATVNGSFNAGTDVYEIPADSTTTFGTFNNLAGSIMKTVMDVNKWGGAYTVVCDSIAFIKFQAQAAQGATNATNLSFNFMGVEFIHSVGLYALGSGLGYTEGFWIAVPNGTIGSLPHIPKENRLGVDTKVATYGSIYNPIDGQLYAVHSYETSADATGTGGYTQDVVTEIETSIDLAFEHAPCPASGESPLLAFAISGS